MFFPSPPPSELGGRGSQLGHAPAARPGDAELSGDRAPLLGRVEQRQQGEATTTPDGDSLRDTLVNKCPFTKCPGK